MEAFQVKDVLRRCTPVDGGGECPPWVSGAIPGGEQHSAR